MVKMTKSVTINAPVEKVFTFMRDPNNLPEIFPNLTAVKEVKRSPLGGFNYKWVYKLVGLHLDGTSEVTDYITNQRLVMMTFRGFNSTFSWNFASLDNGTRLTLELQNVVPIPVLGRLVEVLLTQVNGRDADMLLSNLKTRMEVLAINTQRI